MIVLLIALAVLVYAAVFLVWRDERRAKKVGRKARSDRALHNEFRQLVHDEYRERGR